LYPKDKHLFKSPNGEGKILLWAVGFWPLAVFDYLSCYIFAKSQKPKAKSQKPKANGQQPTISGNDP